MKWEAEAADGRTGNLSINNAKFNILATFIMTMIEVLQSDYWNSIRLEITSRPNVLNSSARTARNLSSPIGHLVVSNERFRPQSQLTTRHCNSLRKLIRFILHPLGELSQSMDHHPFVKRHEREREGEGSVSSTSSFLIHESRIWIKMNNNLRRLY